MLGVAHLRDGTAGRSSFRSASSKAATGLDASTPITRKPGGGCSTESPWLIHTVCSGSRPAKSSESVATVATARPYSRPFARNDLAAADVRHPLHPVAEAEHRHAEGAADRRAAAARPPRKRSAARRTG